MVPHSNKSPRSVKAIQPKANSSKGPQHVEATNPQIYRLRDAMLCNMEIGVQTGIKAVNATLGTPAYLAAYPEALTTALEGLSNQEKREHAEASDEWNEEGPPDEKRESKYLLLQTACLDFHLSHVSGMPASLKVIKHSWLTSRGQWVSELS